MFGLLGRSFQVLLKGFARSLQLLEVPCCPLLLSSCFVLVDGEFVRKFLLRFLAWSPPLLLLQLLLRFLQVLEWRSILVLRLLHKAFPRWESSKLNLRVVDNGFRR